ncbi:GNAT family N-acetyltransferase [Paenibacillus sp. JCM 10914]|uniref:GNAT family N-acetyltransferase n=1 Tax=Paenibacillus sp. JCM 10914 TaxID=1236974 RepID=UPI0003CC68A2|nr:GNAT family N-acetyltransferase [Paenibacillus sp. JCM 10914]GAE06382.1 GMP synthase [Paenibacillus sp. JCM 10914]
MLEKLWPQDDVLDGREFMQNEVAYNLIHLLTASPETQGWKLLNGRMIFAKSNHASSWLWVSSHLRAEEREPLLEALVKQVSAEQIIGVVSEPEVAAKFAELYAKANQRAYRHAMTMEVYHCPVVNKPVNVAGTSRLATLEDTPIIARFLADFSEDAYGVSVAPSAQHQSAERMIRNGGLYLWTLGETPVSMAQIAHRSVRHGRINAVFTPREVRKHGYASGLVADVSQRLLAAGLTPMLYADQANPHSNRVYRSIGYVSAGVISDYKFMNHEEDDKPQ